MFLTVMAYKMFINEKVDVAIIETGIGGEYDSTNILRCVLRVNYYLNIYYLFIVIFLRNNS